MKKKLVYEVSIIRPFIILLLVILHCFAISYGGWDPIDSIKQIPAYYWFGKLISGFRIETIALVAGYIFAFQMIDLKKEQSLKSLIIQKFKRLIIPCWFFGVFYYIIIMRNSIRINDSILYIINGAGHLWFLPMLFWCFIFLWLINYYKPNKLITFIILSAISIMPMPSLPLGLSRLPHFIFYAYLGYCLWIRREKIYKLFLNKKSILFFTILYIILLYINCYLNNFGEKGYTLPLYSKILTRIIKYFIILSGILALYLTVCKFTTQPNFKPAEWVIQSSKICYGVYIFHQFILKYLYYQTSLPEWTGSYLLPWVGLGITFPLSIILSILLLKTKFGRFLIG